MLQNKNIIVGVTGGIAAYKAVEIVSRLRKNGANVHVVMTKAAQNFVTPLTFREISGNPVNTSMWNDVPVWNVEHIALANLADLVLIVPATANIVGKVKNGIADDMLTTLIMATKAPVIFALAMNANMYENKILQDNIKVLETYGYKFIKPESGHLACGISGIGRLADPEDIVEEIKQHFISTQALINKKVLVTAAGTIEAIDPVRYIGNRSSGKMGYAIAKQAALLGASVVLVSGPSYLPEPEGVTLIKIENALEMREMVLKEYKDADIIIKAAAVADYRPRTVEKNKIKKNEEKLILQLEKNPDILQELGQLKEKNQILVGFAAETQDLIKYAKDKIQRKNLDMIVANDVSLPGAGFNIDTNIAKIIYKDGKIENLDKMSKDELACLILDKIIKKYQIVS
mgnify:FL=1